MTSLGTRIMLFHFCVLAVGDKTDSLGTLWIPFRIRSKYHTPTLPAFLETSRSPWQLPLGLPAWRLDGYPLFHLECNYNYIPPASDPAYVEEMPKSLPQPTEPQVPQDFRPHPLYQPSPFLPHRCLCHPLFFPSAASPILRPLLSPPHLSVSFPRLSDSSHHSTPTPLA